MKKFILNRWNLIMNNRYNSLRYLIAFQSAGKYSAKETLVTKLSGSSVCVWPMDREA
jgi:hypothetical protein